MLRTKTTFVIGDLARVELEMPDDADLLNRFANGLDFSRLGSEVQLRDAAAMADHLTQMAEQLKVEKDELYKAAERTRLASKLSKSIDAILDQHDTDPFVELCGKVGVVYFTCQAEANSTLQRLPRHSDDLPLRGTETWLFRLAQLMVGGVSSSRIDKCFENVSIINFNPDRSIEHFLPHALKMAFGMPLEEAQAIVANELDIQHPCGTIGRLPWQTGGGAALEWGSERPTMLKGLVTQLRTSREIRGNWDLLGELHSSVAGAERLVFLGFGFHPRNLDLLAEGPLPHKPELLISTPNMSDRYRVSVSKALKRKLGIDRDDLVLMAHAKCHELLRDYSLWLES